MNDPQGAQITRELVAFLTHNQGDAGIRSILHYIYVEPQNKVPLVNKFVKPKTNINGNMYGVKLYPANYSSWSTNVGKDFIDLFGNDPDTSYTPSNFLKYWSYVFPKKIAIAKETPTPYDAIFQKYAEKYGVDYIIIKVFALIESKMNPEAGNPKYKGMFALKKSTFKKYYPNGNIFDADQNTDVGAKLVKQRLSVAQKYMNEVGI